MRVTAASLEEIERYALQGWLDAAVKCTSSTVNWKAQHVGAAQCFLSSSEPSILVNRVLNIQPDITIDELVEIRELYESAGIARFFLHVIPDVLGADREQLLTAAGYRRYRGWMKFCRGVAGIKPVTSDLSTRRIGTENAADFAAIVGNAFDFQATFQAVIAAVIDDPNWHTYMSFSGATPVGTGGLYIRDGVAYLDFGATHPDYRRRGAQTAVLNTRIRAALDAGCTSIVTMTGEAVPGDEQHSYRNILKAGFEEAYLRENWIPAGA